MLHYFLQHVKGGILLNDTATPFLGFLRNSIKYPKTSQNILMGWSIATTFKYKETYRIVVSMALFFFSFSFLSFFTYDFNILVMDLVHFLYDYLHFFDSSLITYIIIDQLMIL